MLSRFNERDAVTLENEFLRVAVTREGGHLAAIVDKAADLSPLWTPPWKSIEPSTYRLDLHPEYGDDSESKLLAGIMGHNLCLDHFGPPSEAEAKAGLTVHGEASVAPFEFALSGNELTARCALPAAQLLFTRRLQLEGRKLAVSETVENASPYDRPIAWQQHVTLGPPFLARGETTINAPIARAMVKDLEQEFRWPHKPGGHDLSTYTHAERSSGYTAQLLKAENDRSWFFAFSRRRQLLLAYVWKTEDFPWLGMWEENCERDHAPWNSRTMTLGLEFGTTPFPETRRAMIDRGNLFDTPAFRWIEGKSKLIADYYAAFLPAAKIPETLEEFESLLANN